MPLARRIALSSVGFTAVAAHAQEVVPDGAREKSVRIVRSAAPPAIDGVLDEDAWQLAARLEDLHEIQPTEYAPARDRTVIYLMYDSEAIYIGARMHQDSAEVTARILRQGDEVFGDDWFSVVLDPFHDRRSGYRFLTNPNGLRQEGLFQNISEEQWDWQGIWYAAAAIDEQGWTTEIAIPFKTLSFDPTNDTWGINFRRAIAARDERTGWVSRNRNSDPSTSGRVVGLVGLEQGVGLDVVPSISVSERRPFDGTLTTTDTDPSLDVFYKLTPSLTGALTINTDFSATEIDDRQVNLTRFDLFFPEKRDFFLQDADIFEFGGLEENGRPFFSRRIGLSATGEPIDLRVGGKITGRIGRFNIGALSVRQDDFGALLPRDNATVARVSANLLGESSVGMIATEGNPGAAIDNSLAGVDFLYRNSRLPGGKLVEVNAWAEESDTEGRTGDQSAYGFRVGMPNNSGWRGGLRYTRLGEDFEPGIGFLNRPGVKTLNFGTQYTHRPPTGRLRSILGGYNVERIEQLNGELQSQRVEYRLFETESRFGDELTLVHEAEQEQLEADFEIHDDIFIPQGHYSFRNTRLTLETADQRKVWGAFAYQTGDFFAGERTEIAAEINWRPSGRLRTGLEYEWNDIRLPEGNFVTRLVGFRTDVAFSSKLSWVTRIQYDNVSELMGVNLRLHWIPEAGREGFIVINHDLEDRDLDNRFQSAVSQAAVKFSYTFRF